MVTHTNYTKCGELEVHTVSLSNHYCEVVNGALGTNYVQHSDFNVDLHSVDVDDVASPKIKLSDVKHHASSLCSFFLGNSLFWC